MVGKVALVAVVGHEDGAHKTVPPTGTARRCNPGTTMLDSVPEAVAKTTAAAARHAAQLAGYFG